MSDEQWMSAALREAERGIGFASPNPAVGAIILSNGKILARGFHRQAGGPHAEIEAMMALKKADAARGAALYVTLEPCSTHGRTPPCVEKIIGAGFSKVVIGTIDPNPKHAGRGIGLLRAAGIEVISGVMEAECAALNAAFNKWIVTQMPLVIAKAGMSLDGRLARPPGEGQWLTSEASRLDAMELRARVDAILIGANTLRIDNPHLTVRGIPGARQPWRVIVAGRSELPMGSHVFTDDYKERTLVYRNQALRAVLRDLGQRQITSVLIEGGMRVMGEAFDKQLVDEVRFYVAPLLCGGPVLAVGGRGAASTLESVRLRRLSYKRIGNDLCMSGTAEYPEPG